MNGGFNDYLWSLLTRPFKVGEDTTGAQNYTNVLGSILDDAKAALFLMRRAWYLKTAPVAALPIIGAGLKMPQFVNESDEDYRNRLIGAFDWYYWMGTKKGVLKAISYITSVPCLLTEFQIDSWRLGVSRLGVDTSLMGTELIYVFELYFSAELDADTEALVQAIVDIVKPAHTMYQIRYPSDTKEISWVLGQSKLEYETIVVDVNYGLTKINGGIYVIIRDTSNAYIDDEEKVYYDTEESNATISVVDGQILVTKNTA
jgi:hypothetical protein